MIVSGESRTSWVPIFLGVPQGSVLDPLLFTLYTADIPTLFSKYSAIGHLFADDVQAYIHGPPSSQLLLASKIELLSNDLNSWMSSNRLFLNSAKTQLIWVGTPQQLLKSFFCVCYAPDLVGALTRIRVNSVSRWHHWFLRRYSQEGRARVDPGFVNADAILPLLKLDHALLSDRFPHFTFHTTVRDLGVTLDSALTFSQHISNLTRSCYFQLRRLRTIRKAVSVPIFTSIVHAFFCSRNARIDYCNSLLIGLPKTRLSLL